MIVGHLPASYLAFRYLSPRRWPRAAVAAGIAGGMFPDIDIAWFYLVDGRAHHHHDYLTHRPALYALLLFAVLTAAALRRQQPPAMATAFLAGTLLHLALDSVAGRIAWAWPFSDHAEPLSVVQATHSHWLLSFANHWYFQVELAVWAVAIATLLFDRRRQRGAG
ncbi:MAG: metal-dependent hydrolase [Rhodobacteraceae bacterium]|nr:metal-dependent hydrolase [Paracoccaceae bacterium]